VRSVQPSPVPLGLSPAAHQLGADEAQHIDLVPESQHLPGAEAVAKRKFLIAFGQIYLSKPLMTESDGESTTLFPHEARLRNLTCVQPLRLPRARA